jgi:hypothetical protein
MPRSRIKTQKGLSQHQFQQLYGTDNQCQSTLEKHRWQDRFCYPSCNGFEIQLVYGRPLKRYQFSNCGHQVTLKARTIMQAIKLPNPNLSFRMFMGNQDLLNSSVQDEK